MRKLRIQFLTKSRVRTVCHSHSGSCSGFWLISALGSIHGFVVHDSFSGLSFTQKDVYSATPMPTKSSGDNNQPG